MKSLFFLLTFLCAATASELHIVEGGVSPDKKLAIAVVPQKEGEYVDEADGSVYLVKNPSKNILQRLENADSTGGTWGKTTENIDCKWSPDGRFVAINMRTGRLMHDFTVYSIAKLKAVPIILPDKKTNKKSKIYEALKYTANPGEVFTAWLSPTSFTTEEYGLWPNQDNIDFSQYGFPDFDGLIEKVYNFKDSHWILEDLRSPKEKENV
jgi:hypothetical protein